MIFNPYGLGTKWYTFYVKIRPIFWIIFFCFEFLPDIEVTIAMMNTNVVDFATACLTGLTLISYIAYIALGIFLAIKADEAFPEKLFRFIKGFLIYECVYLCCNLSLSAYYNYGRNIITSIILATVYVAIFYFLWYRLNMRYFQKRFVYLDWGGNETSQNIVVETPPLVGQSDKGEVTTEQRKRTLYYRRTETETEITITWKPFASLYFLAPLPLYFLFVWLANAPFATPDAEFIFAMLGSLALICCLICAIVQIIKCSGVSAETKKAMAHGSVITNGSKYSRSNPLRITIKKNNIAPGTNGATSTIATAKLSQDPFGEHEAIPVTSSDQTAHKKTKQRFCKLCGHAIDSATKKCTGCGKQYFKAKVKPIYAVLIVFMLFVGYIAANYFCAVSAMNNQEFIKSQQFFDNLFVSETAFPGKYAYVEAGILMEEGKYIESLNAFKKIDSVPVPAAITDSLKSKIYSAGQKAYKMGDMAEAKKNFDAISDYNRSADYLLLIRCNDSNLNNFTSSFYAKINYNKLIKLLGFEDADETILKYESTAKLFLTGRWEGGTSSKPRYFEIDSNGDSQYNLPHKEAEGYYYISNAIYSIGRTESSATKCFKFSIINEDTISVYCYKDGTTHKLYRQ